VGLFDVFKRDKALFRFERRELALRVHVRPSMMVDWLTCGVNYFDLYDNCVQAMSLESDYPKYRAAAGSVGRGRAKDKAPDNGRLIRLADVRQRVSVGSGYS
jgi:hypothetical protein